MRVCLSTSDTLDQDVVAAHLGDLDDLGLAINSIQIGIAFVRLLKAELAILSVTHYEYFSVRLLVETRVELLER